jgi:hypothetical protein
MVSNFTKIVVGSAIGARIGTSHLRQPPPAQDTYYGYFTYIFPGLIMTALDVLWIALFWPFLFFMVMGAIWFVFTMVICVAGIAEVRATRQK